MALSDYVKSEIDYIISSSPALSVAQREALLAADWEALDPHPMAYARQATAAMMAGDSSIVDRVIASTKAKLASSERAPASAPKHVPSWEELDARMTALEEDMRPTGPSVTAQRSQEARRAEAQRELDAAFGIMPKCGVEFDGIVQTFTFGG